MRLSLTLHRPLLLLPPPPRQTHEETHLTDPPKPYICEHDSCNHKSFSRSHDLIRHRGSVHNEGPAAGKPPQKKSRPPKKKRSGGANGGQLDASVQGSSLDHDEHDDDDDGLHHGLHDESMNSGQMMDDDEDEHGLGGGHHLDHHAYGADDGHHHDGLDGGEQLDVMPEYDPALIEPALFHTDGGGGQGPADADAAGGGAPAPSVNPMDFSQALDGAVKPSPTRRAAALARSAAAAAQQTPSSLLKQAQVHADGFYAGNGDEEEGEVEHALDGLAADDGADGAGEAAV